MPVGAGAQRVPAISTATIAPPRSAAPTAGRAVWAGLVVLLANAALLVLQLVAGRLLAPFVGSSLETWTAVIGVFLLGISLGNWLGGRLADRAPHAGTLAWMLLLGALATLGTLGVVRLLGNGEALRSIPLGLRIPLLTLATCLPASLVLSLITPVTIKIMLPDVSATGRVVGLVYALGTLGSLAGNFLTGFVLLTAFTTHTIVLGIAGALAVLGILSWFGKGTPALAPSANGHDRPTRGIAPPAVTPALPLPAACTLVFLASFCSMALELTASRLLAPVVGVSLYSWTGIIGVVLVGVVLGNALGGWVADKEPKPETLGSALFLAGMFTLAVLIFFGLLSRSTSVNSLSLIPKVLVYAAALFVGPMLLLGTISPQATRLAVSDLDHAGRVAGRVYAWSCAGAIVGTFATGFQLISLMGVNSLILSVGLILVGLSVAVGRPWQRPAELLGLSIVAGAAVFGLYLGKKLESKYDLETNYYAISTEDVMDDGNDPADDGPRKRKLILDHLIHSYVVGEVVTRNGEKVFIADPSHLGYDHEQVQAEFVRLAAERANGPSRLLVVGGGGYTLPRWVEAYVPTMGVDVVEIDPGVTEIAHRKLGLPRDTKINSYHMDGRQFVQERAAPQSYDLVVLDAVSDLSVPYHLLTKEYNDAVKRTLKPNGVYLLTVIDEFEDGELMRAAVRTAKQSFAHVALLGARRDGDVPELWKAAEGQQVGRQVWVIYGSDAPFDPAAIAQALQRQKAGDVKTMAMPQELLDQYVGKDPQIILTDAYAPVDNLIAIAFRKRGK